MLLEGLWRVLPRLERAIARQALVADREQAWLLLRQLMLAAAPSTAAALPGSIVDQLIDVAAVFGLADRLEPDFAGMGNPGLWLGVAKDEVDLLVIAPLDRLTFRVVQMLGDDLARVAPIGRRMRRENMAESPARAFRLNVERGQLVTSVVGQLIPGEEGVLFRAERGSLGICDLITFDLQPRQQGDWVRGSGLDNAAGTLAVLGAGAVLRQIEEALLEHNRRCVLVFPDRSDFDVSTFVAKGAGSVMRPTLGSVLVGGIPVHDGSGPHYEAGMAFAFATAGGAPQVVPHNYQQLAFDLATAFEQLVPGIGQYVPSDAMPENLGGRGLGRVLGLMGLPLSQPHAGQEIAHLKDLAASVWWISAFVALALNLVPQVGARYALGR